MASYSCISCRVSFSDGNLQRLHYKTDWHRYNLKRKVAELPPVTQEAFEEKLVQQKNEQDEQSKDTSQFCSVCNKSFSNQNAFTNHMNSKKHKLVESRSGKNDEAHRASAEKSETKNDKKTNANDLEDDEDDWEDVDEDEDEVDDEDSEAIPPTNCLFCPHESTSLDENLHHMTKSHSFFIPDIDYVTELENLIIYLGAKVGDGKMCLYCNRKSRTYQSVDAAQKHMRDKGHLKIDYEGDSALEYADFYDFSTSYPDYEQQEDDDMENEIGTETGAVQIDKETMEMILPSGARAGHRALKHFYKQSLPPAHLQFRKERAMIKGLNMQYKALGWHGTVSVATRSQMSAHKIRNQQNAGDRLKLGMKANKFQPHFRAQIRF